MHISQIADDHVRQVRDVLNEGDELMVKVLDVDRQGKIRLSRKEALKEEQASKAGIGAGSEPAHNGSCPGRGRVAANFTPMFEKTLLDNGIRILTEQRSGTRAVSLGIWVENGSRHEERRQGGLSHFVEHLLFKGTERRSPQQIAEEMDSVGGVINAFTGKESTCYYAKVVDEHLPLAIDVLSDIFLHSVFDPEEIERERTVILQEIASADENPEEFVHDLFSTRLFR